MTDWNRIQALLQGYQPGSKYPVPNEMVGLGDTAEVQGQGPGNAQLLDPRLATSASFPPELRKPSPFDQLMLGKPDVAEQVPEPDVPMAGISIPPHEKSGLEKLAAMWNAIQSAARKQHARDIGQGETAGPTPAFNDVQAGSSSTTTPDHITPPGGKPDVPLAGISVPHSRPDQTSVKRNVGDEAVWGGPVTGSRELLPPELAHNVMGQAPSMVHQDMAQGPQVHKGHLLQNILKAMGLAAGGVALAKFGGPGALEGGLGGLASGWAHTKKQIMDEDRKMSNEALQRQLDDAHSVVQGLMAHQVDTTKIPELHKALQTYVNSFTKGKTNLQEAQMLNLAYAQHVHEVQQQLEATVGRGEYQQAYQQGTGRNAAAAGAATISPKDAAAGNFMMTPAEAAQARTLEQHLAATRGMQQAGFSQENKRWNEMDQRGTATAYNQHLEQLQIARAHLVQEKVASRLHAMGPMAMGLPPEQMNQLRAAAMAEAQQELPDPTPPPAVSQGSHSNLLTPPPNRPTPTVSATEETRSTADGKKWRKVPGGWQQIQ